MILDQLRWGIIGCGDVCEVKSGPALYKTPGSRLVAVMRRDAERAADFARRHNVPRHYTDADQLIADPEVNIVYVATPPGSHRDYALRVAAAGKPCYVEKPMARTHRECREMVDAFAAKDLPLYVAYYRRGMERFLKTKRLIEEGRIGRFSGLTYRFLQPSHRRSPGWRVSPAEAGAGLFLDLASHTLDVLDFLLGPIENVAGVARNVSGAHPQVEDAVAMSFTIAGAPAVAGWNFAADAADDTITFHGTDGTIQLSTFGDDPVILTRGQSREDFPFPRPEHVHSGLVATIVEELTTGRKVCPSTGVTAARTSAVMDAVLTSFYGDRDGLFG
jgi:predicted dehydrogenase